MSAKQKTYLTSNAIVQEETQSFIFNIPQKNFLCPILCFQKNAKSVCRALHSNTNEKQLPKITFNKHEPFPIKQPIVGRTA